MKERESKGRGARGRDVVLLTFSRERVAVEFKCPNHFIQDNRGSDFTSD